MIIELIKILIGGLCVGLASSVTVGPVAVLCIQRTLSKGHLSGIMSGLGVACADTLLAILAFSVYALLKSYIDEYSTIIQICGGAIVIIVGVFIFFQNPVPQIRKNRAGMRDLWQDFVSMFGVTLANPTYILIYVTLFATFGLSNDIGELKGMAMLTGVFAGCAGWWLLLTSLINLLRSRFTIKHLRWLNRISGGVIASLGTITLLSTLFNLYIEYIDELF